MTKIRALVFLTLCIAAIQFATAQTLREDLAGRYRAFARAMQRNDMAFLNTYLSPTFTVDLPNNQTGHRDDAIKGFGDLRKAVTSLDWTFKLSKETIAPNGVTVIADGHMTATAIGPDKKKHHVDLKGQTEDRWILQDNIWMLDHVHFLKLEGTIDGKPAPIPGLQGS